MAQRTLELLRDYRDGKIPEHVDDEGDNKMFMAWSEYKNVREVASMRRAVTEAAGGESVKFIEKTLENGKIELAVGLTTPLVLTVGRRIATSRRKSRRKK